MSSLERGFERALWHTRWLALLAVAGSLLASLAAFFVASVEAVRLFAHLAEYARASTEAARHALRVGAVAQVVAVVDGYLLAVVLLIFAFGLYELFVSPLDEAQRSRQASHVLVIRNLDDLKNRLAKVIVLIMVVSFAERVLAMRLERPVDLVWAAAGIALIGLALYLLHAGERDGG